MTREQWERLERKLSIFSFGRLQDLVTLYDHLEKDDMTVENVREFIEYTKEAMEKATKERDKMLKERTEKWNKKTHKCPDCREPLMLRPITIAKGKGNREGYTCHWYCREENCNFEEYSHEDFKETYSKIMGG